MNRRAVAVFGMVAALALSGCASDDYEERYNALHGDMIDVVTERDDARHDLADAYIEKEALEARLLEEQQARRAADAAANESADLLDQYAKRLAEIEADRVALPPAEPKFDSQAALERVRRSTNFDADLNEDGDIEIHVPADVTFASGEASLTKSGKAALRSIAPQLTGEFATHQIRVEGHTDSDPLVRTKKKWGDNRGLGSARANAVTQFLEGEFRIAPSRILSVSLGDTDPVVPNNTKANKARNRRVAIVVVMPNEEVMTK